MVAFTQKMGKKITYFIFFNNIDYKKLTPRASKQKKIKKGEKKSYQEDNF